MKKATGKKSTSKKTVKKAVKKPVKKSAVQSVALAVNGGPKVWDKGFPMWPSFSEESLKTALEPLVSGKVNYWTGPVGMQFETAFAKWLGVRNAISVTNGTAALHTAIASLGIGPGDEVICPSYSFIASSFCVLQAGALPVFTDVGYDHQIDPKQIEEKITERTRGIVVVHLYGVVVDMDPIMKIATTQLWVHDQDEALSMSDRLAVFNDGRIEQVEAVFTTVPYHMPSPWVRGAGRR